MNKDTIRMIQGLSNLGIRTEDAFAIRRIAMTLHRWNELECGDGNDRASWSIERDDETDKPYMVTYPHTGKSYRRPIPDREKGALARLAKIMAKYPDLQACHQTDPRGCSVYIVRNSDIPNGSSIREFYTRGQPVHA